MIHTSIRSFLSMVTLLSVPDINQVNLACYPKACLLACAKTLSTLVLSDGVANLTLCCQAASYITSSPSLGHVTPLTRDGCLPPKDGRVMALIQTSRRSTITCHSQSVCREAGQMQRGSGSSGAPSEKKGFSLQHISLSWVYVGWVLYSGYLCTDFHITNTFRNKGCKMLLLKVLRFYSESFDERVLKDPYSQIFECFFLFQWYVM